MLDINYIGQQCTSLPLKCARATNKKSVVNQSTNQTNNQDNVEQENPNINPLVAVLCGWQDVPKQSTDIETSEATDKAMLGTEIANATSPVIILASRFDSISDLPKSLQPRPLLITGAAKAIQKNILLAQKQNDIRRSSEQSGLLYNSRMGKQRGSYQHASAQIFVSSGIGTRGLPFRFYRPTIDVLTIR